jgi:hypothetical protein
MEARVFLSTSQFHYPNFSSSSGLVGNGFGGSITSGNKLRLTDNVLYEARSVWRSTPVAIDQFRSTFSYRANSGDSADGFCFVIQNGPTTALGNNGLSLAYEGIDHSGAACFNIYNHHAYGSKFGFATNGEEPPTNTDMAPIDLHSGHLFHLTVKYDGNELYCGISDATDRSKVFSVTKKLDLAAALGSDTAIVGFTASTGDHASTQDITSWDFSGSTLATPTIVDDATANPNPVTGASTGLDVLGADDLGESNLTYTWSLVSKPQGAANPKFSSNGTNSAKSITVQFFKAGDYTFRCTITDTTGGSVFSDVAVTVQQTASTLRMNPHAQKVDHGQTVQYRTTVLDQFNESMVTQPKVTYFIASGEGTIDPDSGLFTASGNIHGHVDVGARAAGVSGTVGVTVRDA